MYCNKSMYFKKCLWDLALLNLAEEMLHTMDITAAIYYILASFEIVNCRIVDPLWMVEFRRKHVAVIQCYCSVVQMMPLWILQIINLMKMYEINNVEFGGVLFHWICWNIPNFVKIWSQ